MFSCKYCEILKNTYFEEHLPTTASVSSLAKLVKLEILFLFSLFPANQKEKEGRSKERHAFLCF